MAANLQDLNTVARRLILELREGVERLERMEGAGGASPALSRDLLHKAEELHAVAAQMDRACRQLALQDSGGGGAKRELWRVSLPRVRAQAPSAR